MKQAETQNCSRRANPIWRRWVRKQRTAARFFFFYIFLP